MMGTEPEVELAAAAAASPEAPMPLAMNDRLLRCVIAHSVAHFDPFVTSQPVSRAVFAFGEVYAGMKKTHCWWDE